ncbi:MAG TPA: MOSC domain-containing protein [Candidatus Limnocylindrales bacterium]|nr:MOSC domain-containing protein [Candidatus Limnocylindrales bacterium]
MDGRVLQVSVSPGGVPKVPVGEARVERHGLVGDRHDHDRVHGGPHRAVALFAVEAIERVRADGHPDVGPGAVGENLTTSGIELSLLPVGTRLAIGGDTGPLLEISAPANPCDVIKGAFAGGKSGRISILLHPADSRMYARVLREGTVQPGDGIEVLPPLPDGDAAIQRELDLLDAVEGEAWLAMWEAAASAGLDVRIIDEGDLLAAASPDLPGSVFNRSFGMRLVPIQRPRVERFFRAAGTTAWHVGGVDDPTFAGETPEGRTGVHVGPIEDALERAHAARPIDRDFTIREVDPGDADDAVRWAELFAAGFGVDGPLADAWRRFNPFLVRARGYHEYIGSLDGRDVAVSALFVRRRVGWLGGGTVLPEVRGQHIHRVLLADRIRRAEAAGARRVMATADIDSRSAANLEALGLQRIWTRGLYRVDPEVG